jgi:site-specific recombinase XerD
MERIAGGEIDGRNRMPSTVAKYLGALKQFGRWARSSGHIRSDSPLLWLEIPAPEARPPKRRAPTLEDLRWLLERWPREERIVAYVLESMLLTGARPGAIREIRRRDLRMPTEQRHGALELAPLKGGSLEVVEVAHGSRLHKLLQKIVRWFTKVRGYAPRSSDRIVVLPSGRLLSGPDLCRRTRRATDRIAKHRRRHLRGLRPYDFRHGALTDLARLGVDERMRATYAGHRAVATQARYIHLTGADAAAARATIEGALAGGRASVTSAAS